MSGNFWDVAVSLRILKLLFTHASCRVLGPASRKVQDPGRAHLDRPTGVKPDAPLAVVDPNHPMFDRR